MHSNATLIHTFYSAFQQRDHETMATCYHPNVQFRDPVFTNLRGKQVVAMWHMLCERGTDLQLTYGGVQANEATGSAKWEAQYTSGGNPVHNIIEGPFTFKDGRINKHWDQFDLRKWMGMALGPLGRTLGWLPILQNRVRRGSMASLEAFARKYPQYET